MTEKKLFVRELQEDTQISAPFLVKHAALQVGKTGKPYLNLVLMDRTGEIEGRVWDDVTRLANIIVKDAFILVEARCQAYQSRKQLVVKSAELLREDEVVLKDFVMDHGVDAEALYAEVLRQISTMKDPYYRALAEAVLRDDADIVDRIKRAPAAKSMHHAYRSGLIEHVVSINQTLDFLSSHYAPYVDRDLMFLGGFFHDICKLWELSYDKTTDYTMEGRLIGHLAMGIELVERKVQELEREAGRLPGPFPIEKKLLVKHVILAHHGELEYGSPKRPKCLEALLVHYIDDLDSKVNAIRMFTQNDLTAGAWTGLNRTFERFFYKPEWARK